MVKKQEQTANEPATIAQEDEAALITEHGDDTLPPLDTLENAELQRSASDRGPAADPRPWMTVNLSDYSGGPTVHLLRSHKYKQIQIRFDKSQPDEQYLAMLKQAGWKDRTESEGVWTKQIDPDARWQSVAQMEQEFKDVANAIREAKGMKPVLETRARA
jgi:hypothetical protein